MKNPRYNQLARDVGLPPWTRDDSDQHKTNLGDRLEVFADSVYQMALNDVRKEIESNLKRLKNVNKET